MKTSGYNIMRDDSALLEEHENSPSSFSVYLFPDHWTLNSGPKFSYNNPISSLLDDIRAFRIPADFIQIFDEAGITYYNGCLIVEILDYRPAKAKEPILERPDRQRVVLRPNGETLWADICIMNAKSGSKLSDIDALQLESKILLSTSTPLCMNPDPSLARIVNTVLRVSTPNVPNSLKRKATAMVDLEEDETEKAKRAKIMQFMNPLFSPSRKPFERSYKILSLLAQRDGKQHGPQAEAKTVAPIVQPSGTMAPQDVNVQQTLNKGPSTIVPQLTTTYSQQNAVPHQPTPIPAPQTRAPSQLQHATDPSQRMSPSKQQQTSSVSAPQPPPSQSVTASQANVAVQQPQPQGQQTTQPTAFNPPLPSADFLNQPPASRRRPSLAANSATPAIPNASLPAVQSGNQPQSQPPQLRAHTQSQAQPLTHPHQQIAPQPAGQPQRPPALAQAQQARPAQVPPNMSNLQTMRNAFYTNTGGVPITQAAVTTVGVQRQNLNGRNTPISRANSSASPAPASTAMVHSPAAATAAAAAMMSRQNTPAATNIQVARASPHAGNHPIAARGIAAQNVPQQQPQPTMPGGQPMMMQTAAAVNPALAYHYQYQNPQQQQQHQQRIQAYLAQHRQAQQLHQQGLMASGTQQQQQTQHPGTVQSQQSTQEQNAGVQQQAYGNVVPPQAYNYMQMNQPYLWSQAAMGRGMARVVPNGQLMPEGMTLQQMQALGRGGGLPGR